MGCVNAGKRLFPLRGVAAINRTSRVFGTHSRRLRRRVFLAVQALRLVRASRFFIVAMHNAASILRALSLNNFDELVRWAQIADKMEIAMLAPVVCEAATNGDQRVIEILEDGARVLSEYTEAVAMRLHLLAPKVMLIGGLFHRDSIYTHTFRRRLKKILPDARVANVEQAPEMGAAWLAAELQRLALDVHLPDPDGHDRKVRRLHGANALARAALDAQHPAAVGVRENPPRRSRGDEAVYPRRVRRPLR